jgi:hypothetical protein
MRIPCWLSVLPYLAVVSCGLFDPRPVEYPSIETGQDPFKFASLLYGTDKKFTQVDNYNFLFADPAYYVDIDGNTYDKGLFTQHLYEVQNRFKIESVLWSRDSLQDYIREDTFFMDRKYHIVLLDTLVSPSKQYDFSDKASFKVKLTATKTEGSIFSWKDKFQGKSIFHPLFKPDY